MSRLSQSARSCQTTETPRRFAASGSAGTGLPSSAIAPDDGGDVAGDAAHQGGLAGAVLARQGDQLAGPHPEIDAFECGQRAEAHRQAGHRQQGRRCLVLVSGGGGHGHIVVRNTCRPPRPSTPEAVPSPKVTDHECWRIRCWWPGGSGRGCAGHGVPVRLRHIDCVLLAIM